MQLISHHTTRLATAVIVAAALLALTAGSALAHEGREVGDYRFVVGWLEEPAYEGFKNGVDVQVTKVARDAPEEDHHDGEHGDHGESMEGPSGASAYGHGEEMAPVEGLQDALRVEVVHQASGQSRVLDLHAVRGAPGHYAADLLPTIPGVYEFRVFGSVEGVQVDESFLSMGAGGQFDDIRSSADLQFPETLPSMRELESAVRGALDTAQQAQDAALAAQAGDDSPDVLSIVAIVLGALGIASGLGAVVLALRRK